MNIEALRDDPTAHQLIELLFPDELAEARAMGKKEGREEGREEGIKEGIKRATEDLMHRVKGVLSDEQIEQLLEK